MEGLVDLTVRLERLLASIGANVHRLRLERRLTQKALAGAADLDLRFLQRVERGQTNLSVAVLVALAAVLRTPVPALFKPGRLAPARPGRPRAHGRRGRPAPRPAAGPYGDSGSVRKTASFAPLVTVTGTSRAAPLTAFAKCST